MCFRLMCFRLMVDFFFQINKICISDIFKFKLFYYNKENANVCNVCHNKVMSKHSLLVAKFEYYRTIKAALSVTFDIFILKIMFLFFKNTVKILKFRYTFYLFRNN